MSKYKIAVIGSNGKMGKICLEELNNHKNFEIVATVNRNDNLDQILFDTKPEIAVDLTSSESVYTNTKTILKHKIKAVIGSSGLLATQIAEISDICKTNKIGALIIPNFSIGMALITKISAEFSKYYNDTYIFEYHHAKKIDKVSGTANHCSQILNTTNIYSIRSNNFVAKHQIIIAGEGERILLDHETYDRQSFKRGISISFMKVIELNNLVVGLENIL